MVATAAACLPRLPVNGRLAHTEIDLRAAGVAAAARDGVVSAAHARRVIAALLYGSSIPESVAAGVTALAAEFGTDEVMVSPIAGAYRGTPADASPAREETLRLLAKELG